jgi:hypothetical protein
METANYSYRERAQLLTVMLFFGKTESYKSKVIKFTPISAREAEEIQRKLKIKTLSSS